MERADTQVRMEDGRIMKLGLKLPMAPGSSFSIRARVRKVRRSTPRPDGLRETPEKLE
jgi:hypothetical protein